MEDSDDQHSRTFRSFSECILVEFNSHSRHVFNPEFSSAPVELTVKNTDQHRFEHLREKQREKQWNMQQRRNPLVSTHSPTPRPRLVVQIDAEVGMVPGKVVGHQDRNEAERTAEYRRSPQPPQLWSPRKHRTDRGDHPRNDGLPE